MVKDKKISEVHKVLQLVERYLAKEKFIAGNHLTLAGSIFQDVPLFRKCASQKYIVCRLIIF